MKGAGLLQVTVFNPLSWTRCEWVEVDVVPKRGEARSLRVEHEGRAVPSVLVSAHRNSDGSILEGRLAILTEVPGLAVAAYSVLPVKDRTEAVKEVPGLPLVEVDPEALVIRSPLVEARLDPSGGIASLRDRRSGEPILREDGRGAFLAATVEGKDVESHGRWTLSRGVAPTAWAVATERGFIADIPYTLELTFRGDSPRIDVRAAFDLDGQRIGQVSDTVRDGVSPFVHEKKLRLKLRPALATTATGVRDVPFAVAETGHKYVEGHYWTALADGRRGVAFYNRGAMGAVREADGGFSLPLAYSMYYIWGTRMLRGRFEYTLAIEPFAGPWPQADLHRKALAFNRPVLRVAGAPGLGELGETVQPLALGQDRVLVSALYSDEGRVLLRLFEPEGRAQEVSVLDHGRPARLVATDLLGRGDEPVSGPLALRPWQFRTFRLETGGR
jgi:hypothetical protein